MPYFNCFLLFFYYDLLIFVYKYELFYVSILYEYTIGYSISILIQFILSLSLILFSLILIVGKKFNIFPQKVL